MTSEIEDTGNERESARQHQGVLFKRRDVFNREWRPRWFVLHSNGALVYHLLTSTDHEFSSISLSTPLRRNGGDISESTTANAANYDNAPRGTIYLRGCQVVPDEQLSRTDAGIFCITITAPNKNKVHLAATSEGSRNVWLDKLRSASGVWQPREIGGNSQQGRIRVRELALDGAVPPQPQPMSTSGQNRPSNARDLAQSREPNGEGNAVEPQLGQVQVQDQAKTDPQSTQPQDQAVTEQQSAPTQATTTVKPQPAPEPVQSTVESEAVTTKWTTMDEDSVYSGLNPEIQSTIQSNIDAFLPLCIEEHKPEQKWRLLFENKDGVTCHTRKLDQDGRTMIKSDAVIDHHPKQVFNLVIDIKRRQHFEKNVRFDKRLKQCNPFTFIDYYAYRPVWPTSARDFLVLLHWRVLTRGSEKAILACGFSYPQADHLFPTPSDHVRGKLQVTMFVMRLMENNRCHATRLLSYDLGGRIPPTLTSTIMQQQATLPSVIADHLAQTEPDPPVVLSSGDIDNETLIRHVIDKLAGEGDGLDAVRRRLRFADSFDSWSAVTGEETEAATEPEEETVLSAAKPRKELPVTVTAILLLSPVVLWRALSVVVMTDGNRALVFLLAVYHCLRVYFSTKLGPPLPDRSQVGTVTCRLDVNLRGVLRYLPAEKQKCEIELSVVHVVIRAVGKALKEMELFNSRKVEIPILGIKGSFNDRSTADVSFLDADENFILFQDCPSMTLQDIARRCGNQYATSLGLGFRPLLSAIMASLDLVPNESDRGSVLVVACPDSEGSEVLLDVAPKGSDFNAVVTIGGIRLANVPQPKSVSAKRPKVPHLAVSVSFSCPCASIIQCRQFAERLQQLLEKP